VGTPFTSILLSEAKRGPATVEPPPCLYRVSYFIAGNFPEPNAPFIVRKRLAGKDAPKFGRVAVAIIEQMLFKPFFQVPLSSRVDDILRISILFDESGAFRRLFSGTFFFACYLRNCCFYLFDGHCGLNPINTRSSWDMLINTRSAEYIYRISTVNDLVTKGG